LIVATDFDRNSARAAIRRLLSQPNPPTAMIAGSHAATLGSLLALRDLDMRYPDDVSLICFDNSRWTDAVTPSLTVVTKPIEALATSAVETLLGNLAEIEQARKTHQPLDELPATERLLESQLVLRESCSSPVNARPQLLKGGL